MSTTSSIIVVGDYDQQFTTVPNHILRSTEISLRAKGLLAWLISHRPGWATSLEQMAKIGPEGITAVRSAMNELMGAGLITRQSVRDEAGKITGTQILVHVMGPSSGFPTLGEPTLDGGTPKKNKEKKTNEEKSCPKKETEPYTAEFESFWQAFPARSGSNPKKGAFRAWKARKREGVSTSDLMAAVEQYGRSRVGEDPKFTKMAQTYLGPDEHWKADLEVVTMNVAAGLHPDQRRATCPVCSGSTWEFDDTSQETVACRNTECTRGTVPDLTPPEPWANGVEPF